METNLMDCSPDLLQEAERLGSLAIPLEMVASLLGVRLYELKDAFDDPENPVRIAYIRGLSIATVKIREEVMSLAEAGSPNSIQTAALWLSAANLQF